MIPIRRTIVVVVLALVGGVAAWLIHRGQGQGGRVTAPGPARALLAPERLPVDEVTEVVLAREGERPIVMRRGDTEPPWRQVEPFVHPLDPFSVRQLMVQASQLVVTDTIHAGDLTGAIGNSPDHICLNWAVSGPSSAVNRPSGRPSWRTHRWLAPGK